MNRMGHKKAKLALEVYARVDPRRIEPQQTPSTHTFSLKCRT